MDHGFVMKIYSNCGNFIFESFLIIPNIQFALFFKTASSRWTSLMHILLLFSPVSANPSYLKIFPSQLPMPRKCEGNFMNHIFTSKGAMQGRTGCKALLLLQDHNCPCFLIPSPVLSPYNYTVSFFPSIPFLHHKPSAEWLLFEIDIQFPILPSRIID